MAPLSYSIAAVVLGAALGTLIAASSIPAVDRLQSTTAMVATVAAGVLVSTIGRPWAAPLFLLALAAAVPVTAGIRCRDHPELAGYGLLRRSAVWMVHAGRLRRSWNADARDDSPTS